MQLFFLVQSSNQFEDDFENFCNIFELTLNAVSVTNLFELVPLAISTQGLATGILVKELTLKALTLMP